MKRVFALILLLALLLSALPSCGSETPGEVPGSSSGEASGSEASQTLEPITEEPETDPFAGAEPLPEDLTIPENIRQPDGTVIGTIVLPAGADANEGVAAEELKYHIEKVTGASMPVIRRPGEGYGSLIVCSTASLPAVAELFADDIAWLADTGDGESTRWCDDGFAIRTVGKDIYIIGNTSRGALNGAYDWIEENLGVLWVRADEELGLIYDEQPEVTVSKTDYREKSPFQMRGWIHSWGNTETHKMWSRNKLNWDGQNAIFTCPVGGYIKSFLMGSPLYDPEETEYWNTDEEGNRLSPEESLQVNFYSEKAIEALAAACVVQLQNGWLCSFVGEEDVMGIPYSRPYDTQPFEYAPGQFVNPEDEDYVSTVFFTFINKIARKVKEEIPDGKVGTYAYQIAIIPPRCEIEDNVYIWLAPINEDMCFPLMSELAENKKMELEAARHYWKYVPGWAGKSDHIEVYNYYGIGRAFHQVTLPVWERMQQDIQLYVEYGFEGVSSEGVGDGTGTWDKVDGDDNLFPAHCWNMNGMLWWIYSKLAWNPYEDVNALIQTYCERVYGDAASYMLEYYRLMKQGYDEAAPTMKRSLFWYTHHSEYYKGYIRPTGIGHPIVDALNAAYDAASGPIKDVIGYMKDAVFTNLSSFRSY